MVRGIMKKRDVYRTKATTIHASRTTWQANVWQQRCTGASSFQVSAFGGNGNKMNQRACTEVTFCLRHSMINAILTQSNKTFSTPPLTVWYWCCCCSRRRIMTPLLHHDCSRGYGHAQPREEGERNEIYFWLENVHFSSENNFIGHCCVQSPIHLKIYFSSDCKTSLEIVQTKGFRYLKFWHGGIQVCTCHQALWQCCLIIPAVDCEHDFQFWNTMRFPSLPSSMHVCFMKSLTRMNLFCFWCFLLFSQTFAGCYVAWWELTILYEVQCRLEQGRIRHLLDGLKPCHSEFYLCFGDDVSDIWLSGKISYGRLRNYFSAAVLPTMQLQ